MKVKLSQLVPNPFRKELGGYDEEHIKEIMESCGMSKYGTDYQFDVRKNKDKYELVFGHHRFEAFKRFYGKDHEVSVVIKDYDNDLMWVEMCRENLTQKGVKFMTVQKIVSETKRRMESVTAVTVSTRAITNYLSADGRTIDHVTVMRMLSIDNLVPELKARVCRTDNISDEEADGKLPIRTATHISSLPKYEQIKVVKALNNSSEHRVMEHEKIIQRYKKSSDEEKEAVLKGKIDIALVGTRVGGVMASRKPPEKPDLDELWEQAENDILHATILINGTAKYVDKVSQSRLNSFGTAVSELAKTLKQLKEKTNVKLIEN